MIPRAFVIWVCLVPFPFSLFSFSESETAEWVARQADKRDVGSDGSFQLKMRLFDRQQRVRERELTIETLRAQPDRGAASKSAIDGDRMLIRFTYPNDINGTAFLVWEHPDGEDERFLYLPALARVRRITGADAQDSFVGSDFTYEDISGREVDDYTYTMVEHNATWTGPDAKTSPSYRIESRAKDPQARFPRVVSTVRKGDFVLLYAEIYNRRDERQKIYDVRRLELIQSIWTLSDVSMTDASARTRTDLELTNVRYNIGLKESDFSRRELEAK
jgi:hypothetical protein